MNGVSASYDLGSDPEDLVLTHGTTDLMGLIAMPPKPPLSPVPSCINSSTIDTVQAHSSMRGYRRRRPTESSLYSMPPRASAGMDGARRPSIPYDSSAAGTETSSLTNSFNNGAGAPVALLPSVLHKLSPDMLHSSWSMVSGGGGGGVDCSMQREEDFTPVHSSARLTMPRISSSVPVSATKRAHTPHRLATTTCSMNSLVAKQRSDDNFDYGLDALGIPVWELRTESSRGSTKDSHRTIVNNSPHQNKYVISGCSTSNIEEHKSLAGLGPEHPLMNLPSLTTSSPPCGRGLPTLVSPIGTMGTFTRSSTLLARRVLCSEDYISWSESDSITSMYGIQWADSEYRTDFMDDDGEDEDAYALHPTSETQTSVYFPLINASPPPQLVSPCENNGGSHDRKGPFSSTPTTLPNRAPTVTTTNMDGVYQWGKPRIPPVSSVTSATQRVRALTVVERSKAASMVGVDKDIVTINDYNVSVRVEGTEGCCETDEWVCWRRGSSTTLPSVLLSEAQQRYCANAENVSVSVVDRCRDDALYNHGLLYQVLQGAVRTFFTGAAAPHSMLRLSLCLLTPNGEYIDLIAGGPESARGQQVEVATSPLFGPCVNGCRWLLIDSVSNLADVWLTLPATVGDTQILASGILYAQLLLQQVIQRNNTTTTSADKGASDVLVSSFTCTSTSRAELYEALMDQRPGIPWRLFRHALGKDPCAVIVMVGVSANDKDAAQAFGIHQRMRRMLHPCPRRGSTRAYLEVLRQRRAHFQQVLQQSEGKHRRGVEVLLEKVENNIRDISHFLEDPETVPVYVDAPEILGSAQHTNGSGASLERKEGTRTMDPRVPELVAAIYPNTRNKATGSSAASVSYTVAGPQTLLYSHSGVRESLHFSEVSAMHKDFSLSSLDALKNKFLSGYNTSIVLLGGSGAPTLCHVQNAGVSDTIETTHLADVVADIFSRRDTTTTTHQQQYRTIRVGLCFYSISGSQVKDLLWPIVDQGNHVDIPLLLARNPVLGLCPRGVTQHRVEGPSALQDLLAVARRTLYQCSSCSSGELVAVSLELKQECRETSDVVVSVMTMLSLPSNQHSLFRSLRTTPGKTCGAAAELVHAALRGACVCVCVLLLSDPPDEFAESTLRLMGDCTAAPSQSVPFGSTGRLLAQLKMLQSQLPRNPHPSSRDRRNAERLNRLVFDLEQLLYHPEEYTVRYYVRAADMVAAKTRPLPLALRTPVTTADYVIVGTEDADEVTHNDTVNQALSAGPPDPHSGNYQQQRNTEPYFGLDYRRDPPLLAPRRSLASKSKGGVDQPQPVCVPTVAIIQGDAISKVVGSPSLRAVRIRGRRYVELGTVGDADGGHKPSNNRFETEETIEVRQSSSRLRSMCLARTVSCVLSGRTAALIAVDCAKATNFSAVSWSFLRTAVAGLCHQVLADEAGERVALPANMMCMRVALIESGLSDGDGLPACRVTDLLSSSPTYQNSNASGNAQLKNSPLCGPMLMNAHPMPIHCANDADRLLADAVLAASKRRVGAPGEGLMRGVTKTIAFQLVVHQCADDDVIVSSLWGMHMGGGELLSHYLAMNSTHQDAASQDQFLLRFLLGGPCYTTLICGLSHPPGDASVFSRLGAAVRAVHHISLARPRLGSVSAYIDNMQMMLQRAKGDQRRNNKTGQQSRVTPSSTNQNGSASPPAGVARLTAMLREAEALLRKEFKHSINGAKWLSTLAHEVKFFSVFDDFSLTNTS